ncbi:MAG TPA: hypothetical protein VIK51_18835 [Vicinamibacteria bacterium]|jgi:hypothetical protein
MKVILFGATGMGGQGALRECLLDSELEKVLAVGRRATGQRHDKLREIVHTDFLDFFAIEDELAGRRPVLAPRRALISLRRAVGARPRSALAS